MTVLFRRDQRRFLILAGASLVILFLLLLSHQQDISPSNVLKWNSSKKPPAEKDTDNDFPPSARPSEQLSSVPYTGRGQLVSTDGDTTMPSTPLKSDPSTKVPARTHGFTLLDRIYLRNGTFFIVTNDPKSFPEKLSIMSQIIIKTEDMEVDASGETLQFISTFQSKEILGDFATVVPGMTVFITDGPQYLSHFYHFWGEVILGAWRVYSTLALDSDEIDRLPFPSRWILPFIDDDKGWRDRAGLNGPLMRLAFPDAFIEKGDLWKDWKKIGTTVMFERTIIVNRRSAHRSPLGGVFFKMIASTMDVAAPQGFWEPVRKSLTNSLFGYVPKVDSNGIPQAPPVFKATTGRIDDTKATPIVTYISRQSTGRRLIDNDHQGLIAALRELEKDGICTVRIPVMEALTLSEQMAETTRSTIMVGVHGNGLTHQMFMPPSLRSAVFEIVVPTGYTFDYEILARNMGHKHYMVTNDTLTTFAPGTFHKGVHMPDNFHGDSIPVYGQAIANMIRLRLTQPENEVEA